ncbi:hypothetical protein JCM6882_003511 [Rhodosporidiobolus microsporus]
MPPRFWSSPFKNAVATPAKRESWYSELPLAPSVANETSDGIVATGEYWLALGGSSGSLVAVPYSTPAGKFGSRAPTLSTGLRTITSFTADRFDDLLYVGGDSGVVQVFDLPSAETFADPTASLAPAPLFSLSTEVSKPVEVLHAHPLASGLVLATSGSTLSVFDAVNGGAAVKQVEMPSQAWSAQWSADGKMVTATGRDGKLRLWDVRQGGGAVAETLAHAGLKPSRHVHLSPTSTGAFKILTTGVTRTRDREYSLFDLRNLSSGAIKTQRLDTNTGVLQPVLDESRGIVYLAGRGDMTLRWVEVGGPTVFTEGATALPTPLASAAILPPSAQQQHLDLQHAEINRLLVISPSDGAVVPVEVKVPRRQYVDFHADLYPPVVAGVPALSSADWLGGNDDDVLLDKRQLEPGRSWPSKEKKRSLANNTGAASAPAPPKAEEAKPAPAQELPPSVPVVSPSPPTASPAPVSSTATAPAASTTPANPATAEKLEKEEPPTASLSALSLDQKPQTRPAFGGGAKASPPPAASPAPSAATATVPTPTPTASAPAPSPAAAPAPSAAKPAPSATTSTAAKPSPAPAAAAAPTPAAPRSADEPFNPGWSRKFLTGKTPLKPDYFDVKDLSATMGNDVQLLKATSLYLLYPLSGPGGRLAVHPLSQKGRLPVHPPALQTGATVVDFEVDPFVPNRVFVACDDGAVRVFELPKEGEVGKEGWEERVNEAKGRVLSDPKMDKINSLSHHPAAKGVLLSVSDDRGNPTARIWDVEKGEVVVQVALPKGGVSSAAWSPDGALLAVSTKNKQIHVLDPRNPSSLVSTSSHDSIRPVRLVWASDSHLVSTGFNRAASRELILYSLDSSAKSLSQLGKITLDISPAPLFPFFDLDTRILFLYSRGERSTLAFEVDLAPESKDRFGKLPAFEHGTLQSGFAFFPKTSVDVKAVEVVKALRLTPQEVQVVSFVVPRAKVEFFQNDVYLPTRNTEKATMSAADYAAGKDKPLEKVDLRPEGMKLLSEAPAPQKTVSTRSKIKNDGLTDSQREKQYMDNLFSKAQDEGGAAAEEEEEEDNFPVRSSHAVVDDDDW